MFPNGKNKLFEAESAYRKAAIHDVFQEIKETIAIFLFPDEIARELGLKANCVERFLNAAASIGLACKQMDNSFVINDTLPFYVAEPSLILFYLVEEKIPDFLNGGQITLAAFSEKIAASNFSAAQILETNLVTSNELGNIIVDPEVQEFLLSDRENYIGSKILHHKQIMYPMFQKNVILEALKTGVSQWKKVFGFEVSTPFDIYKDQPELLNIFTEGLHQLNVVENKLLLENVDLTGVRSILDVGGGSGSFTITLLEKEVNIEKAEIYELSDAISCLETIFLKYAKNLHQKVIYRPGSFFAETRNGLSGLSENDKYDLIILGWILHDWNDESCLQILTRIRHHLSPEGRLFIIEAILPKDKISQATISDIAMLLQTEGKERNFDEYRQLLTDAGFNEIFWEPQQTRRQILSARI